MLSFLKLWLVLETGTDRLKRQCAVSKGQGRLGSAPVKTTEVSTSVISGKRVSDQLPHGVGYPVVSKSPPESPSSVHHPQGCSSNNILSVSLDKCSARRSQQHSMKTKDCSCWQPLDHPQLSLTSLTTEYTDDKMFCR